MERRLAEQVATIWWVAVTNISITTFAIITIAITTDITIIIVFITLVSGYSCVLYFSRGSLEMCTEMVFLFHYLADI